MTTEEDRKAERSYNIRLFLGAVIGGGIGLGTSGFIGLILVFPGMLLFTLLPSFKRKPKPNSDQ